MILLGSILLAWPAASTAKDPGVRAFPGAEGYGAFAKGGRGGDVYIVTNLRDSGPGSLREGIDSAQGPRTIVFEVSGTIELESGLTIDSPFMTIAGQTAPGDGITVKNWGLAIRNTHDVIVRYVRVRPGDLRCGKGFTGDSLNVYGADNLMIDHVSASWSIDETLSVRRSGKVTVQWSFITESLNDSCHLKGPHSSGSLLGPNPNGCLTIHHCLFAHHVRRSPKPTSRGAKMRFQFENNVVYDWRNAAGYTNTAEYGEALDIRYVGNYLVAGPSTRRDRSYTIEGRGSVGPAGIHQIAFRGESPNVRIYQIANAIDSDQDGLRDGIDTGWDMFAGSYSQIKEPPGFPKLRTSDVATAYNDVLAYAGASRSRDTVDKRLVWQVRSEKGAIIDSQSQVGGWPTLRSVAAPADADRDGMADHWERQHGLNPDDPDDRNRDQSQDGYTALEEYINSLATASFLSHGQVAAEPSDDFRIGPHRDCRELLLRSIRNQAETCDCSRKYAHSASQGYLLATIGITLQLDDPFFDPYRRELVDIALGEIEELISAQDRVRGGGPAFGLDYEYDAFQDGSSNPAFTAYTWNSGMTAWGGMLFLDALKESPELEPGNALRYFDLISGWIQYWEPFFTSLDENGAELGYFWYSDSENDADKAVHNTSALIAMAADHWRALRPGDSAARRLGAQADAFFRFFKARLTRMPSGGYTWNYWDDGLAPDRRRAEDTAHALIETQLIRHMEGLGYFPPEEMPGFEKTLMRQVWKGDPVALAAAVDGSGIASRKLARTAPILYATLADRVPNSSLVWETGKSILFSTYLSEHWIDPETGSVDSVRSLALARFLQTRPGAPAVSWTAGKNESSGPRFDFPENQWSPAEGIEAGYSLAAVRGKANASWSLTFPESETPAGLVVSLIWAGRNEARITASSGGGAILSPTLNEKGALRWHRTTFATTGSGPVRFSIDHSVCIHRIVVRRVQPNHLVSTCEAEDAAASPTNGSPAAAKMID